MNPQFNPEGSLHRLGRTEHLTLVGLVFVLPLVEAPKNLLWLAFVLAWIFQAHFGRAGWGGAWRTERDLPFVLLIGAAILSCLFAPPFPQRWDQIGDVLRYVLLGALLARSHLTERQVLTTLLALLAGTMIAAAEGWWSWRIAGEAQFLELHSVGHVNHSLIYLNIVALGTLGALIALWVRLTPLVRGVLMLVIAMQAWLIVTGESRNTLIAYVVGTTILIWALSAQRYRAPLLVGAALAVTAVLAFNPYLVTKTLSQLGDLTPASGTLSSYRVELAATALEAARTSPVTGIGLGNFREADAAQVSAWLASRGQAYDPGRFFHSSHAHSLYFNTLAERGLLGVAALVILLGCWMRVLITTLPHPGRAAGLQPLSWSIGMAGFVGVFVAGLFNTSLHHEHGLLAMFALGYVLSAREMKNG